MAMTSAYLNAVADYGAGLIAYIGLVDDDGTEITGGNPAYARKAAAFDNAVNGLAYLTADIDFDIPAGATVGGWRGFSASTGGINYGGADFPALDQPTFTKQGVFTLLAATTYVGQQNAA